MITFRMRSAMIAVAATAAVGVGVAPAMAAPDDTNVTVTGGSLSITDPVVGDFAGITLSGAPQDTTAAVDAFTVNDATGTGDGWKVTIQASQLAEWDGVGYVADGATLALSSMSLPASTVTALNGTTSAVPTVNAGPFAIDNGAAVEVASAALDTGMGEYEFSAQTLTLSVPAHVYAKQYRSDVTLSVVTGP